MVGLTALWTGTCVAAGNAAPGFDEWGSLWQVAYALAFVLALIVGGSWLMRRLGSFGNSTSRLMRIMGVLAVGSRERVVLVEVGGKQLLLGVAPGRVSTLHILEQSLVGQPSAQAVEDAVSERPTE